MALVLKTRHPRATHREVDVDVVLVLEGDHQWRRNLAGAVGPEGNGRFVGHQLPSTVVVILAADSVSATFGFARDVVTLPADSMSLCSRFARLVVARCADSISLTRCRNPVAAAPIPPCAWV